MPRTGGIGRVKSMANDWGSEKLNEAPEALEGNQPTTDRASGRWSYDVGTMSCERRADVLRCDGRIVSNDGFPFDHAPRLHPSREPIW